MNAEKPLLFVALDGLRGKRRDTLDAVRDMEPVNGNFGFKINLDCFMDQGVKPAKYLISSSRPIFADTKTWNGKRTMTDIAKMLVDAGVDYFNVWVLADNQLEGAIKATEGSKTKVLGVTVLTHYDDAYCMKYFRRPLKEMVVFLTRQAQELGCHGVVLPGTCLPEVRYTSFIKAVPGIRTEEFEDDRHKQEVTPEFAVENEAKIIVCGSPIMKAVNKVAALENILTRMGRKENG
ncbi:MAG: orotidine 5'-phosphate decarboxylase [Candidatus Nealsonbacteria bacterium]|nr:orotidine 5'-phosphate decarboxylase [Candidatus Nealsonbacteria bacterium]